MSLYAVFGGFFALLGLIAEVVVILYANVKAAIADIDGAAVGASAKIEVAGEDHFGVLLIYQNPLYPLEGERSPYVGELGGYPAVIQVNLKVGGVQLVGYAILLHKIFGGSGAYAGRPKDERHWVVVMAVIVVHRSVKLELGIASGGNYLKWCKVVVVNKHVVVDIGAKGVVSPLGVGG